MKKIEDFLRDELCGIHMGFGIVSVVGLTMIWVAFSCSWVIAITGHNIYLARMDYTVSDLVSSLVFAPILEESVFRGLLYNVQKKVKKIENLLLVSAAFSAVFGFVHGNFWNMFVQGPIGFFLSVLFLKAGGLQNKPDKALVTCMLAHGLINAIGMS